MKSDFDMIVRQFKQNDDITIYPIADVHLGSIECMEWKWEKFCKTVLSQKNAYLLLAGDLITNNTRNSIGSPFSQIYRPREQKRRMAEYLEPLRDRILAMTGGNHERRTDRDTDSSPALDIASKLDLEDIYRENMAFLKIQIGNADRNGQRNPTYSICVTHGNGSSIYTTNAAMRAERFGMAIDGIDAIVVGHIHKPQDFPVGKYFVDTHNNKVSIKQFEVVVCTSWMDGSGYGAQKLLQPTVFSLTKMTLTGDKKRINFSRNSDF